MFTISKTFTVAGAHCLDHLTYKSPCRRFHGHNWKITIKMHARKLDKFGMVADFAKIKKLIHGQLDHRTLNEVKGLPKPTAEYLAWWVCNEINKKYADNLHFRKCVRVDIEESEGSIATYNEI